MLWRVLRQDDNGNVFVTSAPMTEAEARALAGVFAARGHKQRYFVDELAAHETALPVGSRVRG